MAFLIKNDIIINDGRELVGVNTAGINTALYVGENIQLDALSGVVTATKFEGDGSALTGLIGSDGNSSITGNLTVEGLSVSTGPSTFTGNLEINDDLLGDGSSNISGINSVTATKFYGDGSELTDIVATVIVSDGIPTGITTAEGDLYYDSTDLTLFTYYDNNWVDAAPVPPGATELEITNAAGITTVTIDLQTEKLLLDGTANQISVGLNPGTDAITFSLESEVAIAGSMTAGSFYGDGSKLTGVGLGTDLDLITTGNIQAGVITATNGFYGDGSNLTSISADAVNLTGTAQTFKSLQLTETVGFGLTVKSDASIEGNLVMGGEIQGPANLIIDPAGIGDNTGAVRIKGDLYVDGTNFTVNSTVVNIADKNIGLATDTSTDLLLDGSGFTIGEPGSGVEKTFQYNDTTKAFESSIAIGVTAGSSFKVGNDDVLTIDTLGSTVLNSSLTGVGTLTDLTVDGNITANGDIVGDTATNISGIASVTATDFYGNGSNLTDIEASTYISEANNDENNDLPMPFLSAVGAGASMYTDTTTNEEFTYNPSTGVLKVKEFDSISDARLKTKITSIEDALGKLASLRGVEYDWVNGSGSSVGVIAQEVQEIYPQLVNDSGLRLTVNYNGLVGLLIAAVNEMAVELAELKAQK